MITTVTQRRRRSSLLFSFFVLLSTWCVHALPDTPLYSCQHLQRKVDLACQHAHRLNGDQEQVISDLPALFLSLKSLEDIYHDHVRVHALAPRLTVFNHHENPALSGMVASCAEKLGIKAPLIVIAHDPLFATAAAAGIHQNTAVLLLGTGLLANMPAHELTALLMHELAHIAHDDIANTIFLRLFLRLLFGLFLLLALAGVLYMTGMVNWPGIAVACLILAGTIYVRPWCGRLAESIVDRQRYKCEFAADRAAHERGAAENMPALFERLAGLQAAQQAAHARLYDEVIATIKQQAAAWPQLEKALMHEAARHRRHTDNEFAARYAQHPSWAARHEALTQG